jgi:dipeptidyl aminopeptidase/acylaminoacyl peptidase
MQKAITAPYGSWRSPISSDQIVQGTIGLGSITIDRSDIYWVEMRPAERGRYAIVRRTADGQIEDVIPSDMSARTRVHEYGGGAYAAANGRIVFSNFTDQRLYMTERGLAPRAMTPADQLRYADGVFDQSHRRDRFICVREDHRKSAREARNEIVAVDLAGTLEAQTLVTGSDFYSSLRLSPDGSRLTWLEWQHPNMPWDGTELYVADIALDGSLENAKLVAGSKTESIFQPEWSPDGVLHFVSDRSGWWNLYRLSNDQIEPLSPMEAEFGRPQWVFGMRMYGFAASDRIVTVITTKGQDRLAIFNTKTGKLEEINTPFTSIGSVRADSDRAVIVASSPQEESSIVSIDIRLPRSTGHLIEVLKRASSLEIDPSFVSVAEPIEFETTGGLKAHGFFYPPCNPEYVAPKGERPPLVVMSHGGPTAATSPGLHVGIQFWTTRGIGVLDVNYGGSTGYGRAYRERLDGKWGIVDVDDCANGALHLAREGRVDGERLAITGGSAGGYTTLCALTFTDVFKAGASHYGVSDCEALAKDTHKFESRYLDRLIGPYPAARELYRERSPIHFAERISAPVIFFQGLEDKIVPPDQAEKMVAALERKGIRVKYVPFEGEQHGFRQAANIKRALDEELAFFAEVFGFEVAR